MNIEWELRLSKWAWWLRLGPLTAWRARRQARKALLATPGVDALVREVMDFRYGKTGWRVNEGNLEALVTQPGHNKPWWGLVGPIRNANTRRWLANIRLDMKGVGQNKPPEAPYKLEAPSLDASEPAAPRFYVRNYADTEPLDDDGRTSK